MPASGPAGRYVRLAARGVALPGTDVAKDRHIIGHSLPACKLPVDVQASNGPNDPAFSVHRRIAQPRPRAHDIQGVARPLTRSRSGDGVVCVRRLAKQTDLCKQAHDAGLAATCSRRPRSLRAPLQITLRAFVRTDEPVPLQGESAPGARSHSGSGRVWWQGSHLAPETRKCICLDGASCVHNGCWARTMSGIASLRTAKRACL